MFDAVARKIIDPPLNAAGRGVASLGLSADAVTLIGLALGLAAATAAALGAFWTALALIAANRIADGLDGAVARAAGSSGFGGYLDIVSDFIVYAAVPLGFAIHDPEANALPACFLLAGFLANGAAFFAFAAAAAERGLESAAQGKKALYYVAGLMEGAETIAFFVLFCVLPGWFGPLAWIFGGLCLTSAAARMVVASRVLRR